ncbi:MAG: tRNA dihydrouridine synthase DusB [Lachnospiraceae bacterium]|nr:tRNA dihydrouridine synthase DusB [Lachnospiraceae bacterium]
MAGILRDRFGGKIPLALGPMAGVTDLPFRFLCSEHGADMTCSEMVSAKALFYKNKNTEELMQISEGEHFAGIQLFGNDPGIMAEMALAIEDRCEYIDVNMGCPVQKVVKNGEGSALMREPKLVEQILKRMSSVLHKPLSVKIRKGFYREDRQAPEIARIAEASGVSFITVHGRTREQFFQGETDLSVIREVKEAVKIPVIGNGGIRDGASAVRMLHETGCDGLMIGQAAMGDPWIFERVRHYLETGEELPAPSPEEIYAMILRHARMLIEENGEHMGILKMRSHASWYLTGFPNASKMRAEINRITRYEELTELLRR